MAFLLPFLPGRVSAPPQILQNLFLTESVHRLPITPVLERSELLGLGELLHRFTLPYAVVTRYDVKDRICQDKEATIDPASVALRLFVKSIDATIVLIDLDRAKATLRQYRRHRGGPSMPLVEVTQRVQVDVRQSIAICHMKRTAAVHEAGDAPDSSTGHGLKPGVHQGDAPRLGKTRMHVHAVLLYMDRNVRCMEKIIGEIFLDHIPLVSKAYDEIVASEGRVILHDVPENRLAPDLHHRLRAHVRFFANSSAATTGKYDHFH